MDFFFFLPYPLALLFICLAVAGRRKTEGKERKTAKQASLPPSTNAHVELWAIFQEKGGGGVVTEKQKKGSRKKKEKELDAKSS